jgi:phytoene dehydrogenase-like protein
MPKKLDAVVIGGGHNGLVCGAYLAKAGFRTLVLERRHVIGGAAVSEQVTPGFTFSTFSLMMGQMHPKVIQDLELGRFGLQVLENPSLFCPLSRSDHILYSKDVSRTQESFARFSSHDAEIYPRFLEQHVEIGRILRRLLLETPVDPLRRDWKSFKRIASLLWRYRKAGKELYRMIDALTQSADDYLSRWFESDIIKAVFAYYAAIGNGVGPKTPGSAYLMLHYIMTEYNESIPRGQVRGGMGTITKAIAQSASRFGLEIKTDAEVSEVIIEDGRVRGVATTSGDTYDAPLVASNPSCKVLFQQLVSPDHLPGEFLDEIRAFRSDGTDWKINLACEAPPRYAAYDKALCGFDQPPYVHIAPDIDYLEKAYDDAKNGWYSEKPFITAATPTILDKSMAPHGKHVVHLYGGHAAYQLKNTTWDQQRDGFVQSVMSTMDEMAPGFTDRIIDMQALTPVDIERILNIPFGHILHGEITLDQLFFMRPVPRYADYRTPIAGLYQCGSSCHPGGGVTGVPGHNAAREILKDHGR